MRHVAATLIVLLLALLGFRYWNARQVEHFGAATRGAEQLAERGQLPEALEALDDAAYRHVSPSVRERLTAEKAALEKQFLRQANQRIKAYVDLGDFESARRVLETLEAHVGAERIGPRATWVEEGEKALDAFNRSLPDLEAEAEAGWVEAEAVLEKRGAIFRNPLKNYREALGDVLWNQSSLPPLLHRWRQHTTRLSELDTASEAWRAKLPDAPESSLNPFTQTKKEVTEQLASLAEKRGAAEAERDAVDAEIAGVLRAWAVAEPERRRAPQVYRALHRIVVTPAWLRRVETELAGEAAEKARQSLMQLLEAAVRDLPDSSERNQTLEHLQEGIGDPLGFSEAVRARLLPTS